MQVNIKAMKLLKALRNNFLQLGVLSAVFLMLPFFASAEQISSFVSDIELKADGSFLVTETIAYDFEGEQRHGIFRYVEKKHPQEASSFWKERFIDIDLLNVSLDGKDVPYELTDSKEKLEVKIGDPNSTISGTHTYEIAYKVAGGYSYFGEDSTEIYWNVTGNGWEVPIGSAEATVRGELLLENKACYMGAEGISVACDSIVAKSASSTRFVASNLSPYSGLTIAHELDAKRIEVLVLERFNFLLVLAFIVPVLAVGIGIFGYRYRTEHKTGNPIIAQYEPYKDFKPMYTGMLFDGRLDPQDITSGIVYLAEQGFLKIKKTEKKVLFLFEVDDYHIELLRPVAEVESVFLKTVLELLFTQSAPVGETLTLSSLKTNMQQQAQNQKLLQQLRKDLKKDLEQSGFFQTNKTALVLLWICGGFLFLMFFVGEFIFLFLGMETLLVFGVALLSGLILSMFMFERRTKVGYEALDHLKGFKLFLSVTDAERFTFHNAPQKSPEQFMEYLPYAIAFGVEKQWAKAFEGITIPDPGWYDGGSAGSFSAVNLTSSLGAFSTSFAASSGSSASSGGGSSGGGGGGGGGGSW
jgi:uncharacterized membrane protein